MTTAGDRRRLAPAAAAGSLAPAAALGCAGGAASRAVLAMFGCLAAGAALWVGLLVVAPRRPRNPFRVLALHAVCVALVVGVTVAWSVEDVVMDPGVALPMDLALRGVIGGFVGCVVFLVVATGSFVTWIALARLAAAAE